MKNKIYHMIYRLCVVCYGVTFIYALVVNWQGRYFMMTWVAGVTPFLVPLFFALWHRALPIEAKILNVVFVYFASLIGSCLGGYSIMYYDKVIHCLSGVMLSELIYIFYKCLLKEEKRKIVLFVFVNAMNALVALMWEIYEYLLLVLFDYDAIRHYATGVHDSLTDMIVALLGGFVLSLYFMKYDSCRHEHFWVSLQRKVVSLKQ